MDGPVLHFDMDAYFASCEELRHPDLRGAPLAVGFDPRRGHGRGVVVAANYAARAFGVRSAMPAGEAVRRCPTLHFVPPDHEHYWDVSRRMFERLRRDWTVDTASVDEGFVSPPPGTGWDGIADFAATVRARVTAATGGLPVSIGVGPNRMVAKVATDQQKPEGTTIVRPPFVRGFLDPLPASRIPGIGPKTTQRLAEIDVRTVRDLRLCPPALLRDHMGPNGQALQAAAQGQDLWHERATRDGHRSIGAERTLDEDTRHRPTLMGFLRRMISWLEDELHQERYWFRSVALKVRYADFTTQTRQQGLARPSADTGFARRVLPRLLDAFLADPRPVRLIGIRLQDVARVPAQRTLDVFDPMRADALRAP